MPIRCEIVSQDRMVFEGDADMVLVPGSQGEMGILPNHAPLLSTLKFGVLRVRIKDRKKYLPSLVELLKFNLISLQSWRMQQRM